MKAYALSYFDFLDDDGQLVVEVQPPPYFDYFRKGYNSICVKHMQDGPVWYQESPHARKKVTEFVEVGYYFYQHVLRQATDSLWHAKKAEAGHVNVPPPYYWYRDGRRYYANNEKERAQTNWYDFFYRLSPTFIIHNYSRSSDSQCKMVSYFEYSQKYDYLYYWFDLCYKLEKKRLIEQLAQYEKEEKNDSFLQQRINSIDEDRAKTFHLLEEGQKEVSDFL